jgi:hypothetical protein
VLLGAAIVVILRMPGVSLGPYSTRLLGIGVVCAGYYGSLRWLRFGRGSATQLRWPALHYAVPALAILGAIFCVWQIVRSWRTEVHGLVRTLLLLILLLALGDLAWICLRR